MGDNLIFGDYTLMKAVTYQGKSSISVKQVDAPTIQDQEDVIVKITSTAICGSDLHLYKGNFPLLIGYIIGHERWESWKR